MSALFLDIGRSAGWAVERADGRVEHGTWSLPKGDAARFFQWRHNLVELKARLERDGDPLAQVVYEEINFLPPRGGVYVAHCYGAAWGILIVWCFHHGIPCRGVGVSTVKAHLTRKATAAKELVTEEVRRRGYKFASHDEADAIALMITVGDKYRAIHPVAA